MNTNDIRKNEAFTPIIFEIERSILDIVNTANADGIDLNDSQIRSILNKVRKTSEGGSPKIPDESPRDQILARLHAELLQIRKGVLLEDDTGVAVILPTHLWTLCIRTVEESLQHHSTGPGSKGYQYFLESFIAKVLKAPKSTES